MDAHRVLCDNTIVPSEEGRVVVRLTRKNPRLKCLFVNVLNKTSVPPVPPQPPRPDLGPEPDPVGPDLVIAFRLSFAPSPPLPGSPYEDACGLG